MDARCYVKDRICAVILSQVCSELLGGKIPSLRAVEVGSATQSPNITSQNVREALQAVTLAFEGCFIGVNWWKTRPVRHLAGASEPRDPKGTCLRVPGTVSICAPSALTSVKTVDACGTSTQLAAEPPPLHLAGSNLFRSLFVYGRRGNSGEHRDRNH